MTTTQCEMTWSHIGGLIWVGWGFLYSFRAVLSNNFCPLTVAQGRLCHARVSWNVSMKRALRMHNNFVFRQSVKRMLRGQPLFWLPPAHVLKQSVSSTGTESECWKGALQAFSLNTSLWYKGIIWQLAFLGLIFSPQVGVRALRLSMLLESFT